MEEDSIMVARCKGICDMIRAKQTLRRPKKLPYLTHSQCRVCRIWFDKTTIDHPRCPCCSTILAILPRENHKKRIYRKVLKENGL
jgi:predicted Zn-ribbon and HTH transcriptional regulator